MTHNDVLRSLRYLLNVSDATLVDIFRLGNREVGHAEVVAFLKRDDEGGYQACSDKTMAHFLNGLVIYKRGKDESRPPQPVEVPVTNNTVLKKIRVAFELKDDDVIALVQKNGLTVSKTELGAFFRRPSHRNYRDCGDQVLRAFLKGLASR
jgi:uncharacterized protein YehS (DUF1456 family)